MTQPMWLHHLAVRALGLRPGQRVYPPTAAISQLLSVGVVELHVNSAGPGSVVLALDMPRKASVKLKQLFRSGALTDLGITDVQIPDLGFSGIAPQDSHVTAPNSGAVSPTSILTNVVAPVIRDFGDATGRQGSDFSVTVDHNLGQIPDLWIESGVPRSVLFQLLSNALKYRPQEAAESVVGGICAIPRIGAPEPDNGCGSFYWMTDCHTLW